MASNLKTANRGVKNTSAFKALRQQIDDLPGAAVDYVKKNFTAGEAAQITADIAGMVDPTPISDLVGGIIGAFRGDWISVGTSVLGMIPYLGDTGKLAKWARLGIKSPKYRKLAGFLNDYTNLKRKIGILGQTRALKNTRAEMWKYYQRSLKGDNCALCKIAAGKIGKNLPAGGAWKGTKGNSRWMPGTDSALSPEWAAKVNKSGGIPYKEGVPDFKDFAVSLPGGGKTMPIEMNGGGGDITRAWKQYREMLEVNGRPLSKQGFADMNKKFTWHHTTEGMQLVPTSLHSKASHIGMRSIGKWPNY